MQRVQYFIFLGSLCFCPGQHISCRRVYRFQCDRVLASEIRDAAAQHGLDPRSLTDLAPSFQVDAIIRPPPHKAQRLSRLGFRKNI